MPECKIVLPKSVHAKMKYNGTIMGVPVADLYAALICAALDASDLTAPSPILDQALDTYKAILEYEKEHPYTVNRI